MVANEQELIEQVKYVAKQTSRLAKKIVGKTFPIKSLTIFAHSQLEFDSFTKTSSRMGKPYSYHNGPIVELNKSVEVEGNRIIYLRIRKPDPERPQVGCNDFVTDFENFKREYLPKHPKNLRLIKRPEYDMIEFHDPSFNVLAYVLSTTNPYASRS